MGSYADMLQHWFTLETGQAMAFGDTQVFQVLEGEFPPSATCCDVWLLSGSRHGVYDPLPWIPPLKVLIQQIHQAKIPLIGICFGHQIIAEALGGKAQKSPKGWGIGLQTYRVNADLPDWLSRPQQELTLSAFHQDQIIECPADAQIIIHSGFCEFAGLVYGSHILTLQGHPEFSSEFEKGLILMRKHLFSEALASTALKSLNQTNRHTDHKITAQWAQQLAQLG